MSQFEHSNDSHSNVPLWTFRMFWNGWFLKFSNLGKMGTGYVRAVRVPFFMPQKSLKGVQIHKLVSETVPKLQKSKVSLSKGHDFQKFWPKFGENQQKFGKNRTKFGENRPKFRKKSHKGSQIYQNLVSQRVDLRLGHTRHLANLVPPRILVNLKINGLGCF